MIPVLYDENETQFESGGIGYLADCTSCIVTEERNGVYECEFSYPCTGPLFKEIYERRYIYATHDDSPEGQPFEIYARSEPIDGIVTYNAHHISYRLSNEVVMTPFTWGSCKGVMDGISQALVPSDNFAFDTNIVMYKNYEIKVPTICREMLGGEENSVVQTYGGEYEFDGWKVHLLKQRGIDTDIEIRYGKNMIDYNHAVDISESYNAVVPYYFKEGEDGDPDVLVTLPEKIITNNYQMPYTEAEAWDLTSEIDETDGVVPTTDRLRAVAYGKMYDMKTWIPSETFEIDFAALWQTEEYKQFAPLQRVKLCDTVLVYFPQYGTEAVREKVVKTVFNTLLDRYDEITLNQLPTTFSGILSN